MLLLGALSVRAGMALTADELAAHFEVQHWETMIEAPPSTEFTVFMSKVEKGKITPETSSVSFHAEKVNQLAVMVSRSEDGLNATVTCTGGTTRFKLGGELPNAWCPLPSKIAASGDYVLGGDYYLKGNTVLITGKAVDIDKNGLVLHLDFRTPVKK